MRRLNILLFRAAVVVMMMYGLKQFIDLAINA